jgi:hypothetical protein
MGSANISVITYYLQSAREMKFFAAEKKARIALEFPSVMEDWKFCAQTSIYWKRRYY